MVCGREVGVVVQWGGRNEVKGSGMWERSECNGVCEGNRMGRKGRLGEEIGRRTDILGRRLGGVGSGGEE